MGILWPQPYKFCGLFPLGYGVCAYIVFQWVLNIVTSYLAWRTYFTLTHANSDNISTVPNDNDGIVFASSILRLWIICATIMHSLHSLSVCFLIYGYWKSKPFIVKVYLYCSITTWILQVIVSYVLLFMSSFFVRVIMITLALAHMYLLLILRTIHLKMTGNTHVITTLTNDNSISASSMETNNVERIDTTQTVERSNARHSISNQVESPTNQTFAHETNSSNPSITTTTTVDGVRDVVNEINVEEVPSTSPNRLHIRNETVIYIVDQLEPNGIDISATTNSNDIALHEELSSCDIEKIKNDVETPEEIPITIYDEDQLNVRGNPILEHRDSSR